MESMLHFFQYELSRLTSIDYKNDPGLALMRKNDLDRAEKAAQTTLDDLNLVRSNTKMLLVEKTNRENVIKALKEEVTRLENDLAVEKAGLARDKESLAKVTQRAQRAREIQKNLDATTKKVQTMARFMDQV